MKDGTKKKKSIVIVFVTVFVCVVGVLLAYIIRICKENRMYLELEKGNYTSVFIADFDTKYYKKEVFDTYIGGNNFVDGERNLFTLGRELKYITKNYEYDIVRIGLNPFDENYELLAGNSMGRWLNSSFYDAIKDNPNKTFQILLYSPSGTEWKSKKNIDNIISSYECLVNSLDIYDNVTIYFPGYEEWVIDNRLLYADEDFGKRIEDEWIPMTFCDGMYVINSQNQWDKYYELTTNLANSQDEYLDMDELDFVFFGDSIIGNYTGVSSIPGDVHALTGASVINLGVGGTKASTEFEAAAKEYFSQNLKSNNRRVYVINYGLNDFFEGIAPNDNGGVSYAGGLKDGIDVIKSNDESALIVVVAPNYVECCGDGTGTIKEGTPMLGEYIETAQKVSEEQNVLFINMYSELGADNSNFHDYLLDGVHLNGNARMKYSKILLNAILNNYE